MACKLAIFEYVNEDNALGLGETVQIQDVDEDLLNNMDWDFGLEVRVKSKTKQGKSITSAAKVVRFGDNRKQLVEMLDRLIEGDELVEIIRNQDALGRGKRRPVAKKSVFYSSDEENEAPVKQVAKKAKVRSSEKQSDKDLLAALKEKTKEVNNENSSDDRSMSALQQEVSILKEMVETSRTSNKLLTDSVSRLEKTNSSLITTVASLSRLPLIVEKLEEHVVKLCDTIHKISTDRSSVLSDTSSQRARIRTAAQPTFNDSDKGNNSQDVQPANRELQNSPAPTEELNYRHPSSDDTAEISIPIELLKKAKKTDARKMTNDLMHGLYSEEFMASHSVSGGGNGAKPAMPQAEVSAIISAVLGHFGDTVRHTDVRFYMREKLNNAIKVQRRKQKKRALVASTLSTVTTPSTASTPVIPHAGPPLPELVPVPSNSPSSVVQTE